MARAQPTNNGNAGVDVATSIHPSAVIWISGRHAVVARADADGFVSTCRIERGSEPDTAYLALVLRAIGDRERVVIMGPGPARLELEREYVAIHRHPDRLVDVEPAGPSDELELLRRLREISGDTD